MNFDHIFSRFQNLNLINLLVDLENGSVSRGCWISASGFPHRELCPLSHGCRSSVPKAILKMIIAPNGNNHFIDDHIGSTHKESIDFITYWDGGTLTNQELQTQITRLWQERIADAEALQQVLMNEPTIKELPDANQVSESCLQDSYSSD